MEIMKYLPFVLIAFFVFMQLRVVIGSRMLKGKQLSGLAQLLGRPEADESRLMLYFYSAHCPQCPPVSELVDKLTGEYPNITKVDALERMEVAEAIGVRGTPTVVMLDHGKVEEVVLGSVNEKRLRRMLDAPAGA